MKVKIKNYEIIEDAELEFKEGLTVIAGSNHMGKSAIFRAIEAAFFNRVGDYFINYDSKYTAVAIENDDNNLIWKKPRSKSKSTVYKINGEVYTKVGRKQPDIVADIFKIDEVSMLRDKVRLNFWKQKEREFFLDKSPAQRFEFLSLSNESDNLTVIVKEMENDLGDMADDIDKVNANIDEVNLAIEKEEKFLESKAGFESVYSDVIDLDSEVQKMSNLDQLVNNLVEKEDKIKFNNTKFSCLQSVLKETDYYKEVGGDIKKLKNLSNLIGTLKENYKKTELLKNKLIKFKGVLNFINVENMTKKLEDYKELKVDVLNLLGRVRELKGVDSKIQDNKYKLKYFTLIEDLDIGLIEDKVKNYDVLSSKLKSIKVKTSRIRETIQKIDRLKDKHAKLTKKLNSFEVCPLCGNSLDDDECF